jgi:hypothetical protein
MEIINDTFMNKKGRVPNGAPVFENENYRITQIPLNYAIDVKIMTAGRKPGTRVKLLFEQFYSPLDRGLEYAKETAEYMIAKRQK